jgi:hypothetical protein
MQSMRGKCNVTADTKERLLVVRSQVLEASRLLGSPVPESLDHCALLLQTAITSVAAYHSELKALPDAISTPDQAAIEEMKQLQRAIGRVKLLLHSAFDFHRHWMRRLGMMTRGYTCDGEPAPVEHGSRVLGRG